MREQESFIIDSKKDVVGRTLESILSPWSTVPQAELPEIIGKISIPIIEIARRGDISPQKASKGLPSHIELNGQVLRILTSSNNNSDDKKENPEIPPPNLRIKKIYATR